MFLFGRGGQGNFENNPQFILSKIDFFTFLLILLLESYVLVLSSLMREVRLGRDPQGS